MRKVVITVAPCDYADPESIPPPEELAQEVYDCCRAGASVVHLHAVGKDGKASTDTSRFRETIRGVREKCDIIIQGSTGGVGLSLDERSVALDVAGVEMGSLNMGSCNIGDQAYINTREEVEYWAEKMKRNRVIPEMAFFEPGMFSMLEYLRSKGLVTPPFCASIALGFPAVLPATPENLAFMVGKLHPETSWSLAHHHAPDYLMHAAAIALGGNVRVGFEDSLFLAKEKKATRNADLVAKAYDLILQLGQEVATVSETRQAYGLK